MSEKLRVAGIVNDSITDGPGLRLAVFLQGCQRNCPGCHNPAALPLTGGTLYTAEELMEPVRKNPLLSGVTLTGGEPLLQAKALLPFTRMVRAAGLSIMLYTGYTFEELLEQANSDVLELLSLCDTMVDGPFLMANRSLSLPFKGSRNQRILDLPKSLARGEAVEQL